MAQLLWKQSSVDKHLIKQLKGKCVLSNCAVSEPELFLDYVNFSIFFTLNKRFYEMCSLRKVI